MKKMADSSRNEFIVDTLGREDLQRLLDDHQKLLILYGFASAISMILDVELLLNEAMNVVFGLVKAERGAIFLLDPKTGALSRGVSRTRQAGEKGSDIVLKNEIVDLVLREGKAVLSLDAVTEGRFKASGGVQHQNIRSCMCVPLESQHHILGILYVDNRVQAGCFSKEELTLVSGIANQTAVALENIESMYRLREERKRVEDILNTLPVAILSINEEETISFINPEAEKLFGTTSQACLNRPCGPFLESRHFQSLLDLVRAALAEGKRVSFEEILCGNGEAQRLLQVNIVPLREGLTRKGLLLALDDVTEKRNLEQEISNAEKLSAIGEMTAGLVHEMINPLSVISGRAQLLLFDKEKDAEVLKAARIIREQVDRTSSITEKLLSFARQRPPQLAELSLHELIDECLETMEEQFASAKVFVQKQFADAPLTIMGDREQLEEIFVNLARNAIQAMPQGGSFTVTLRREGDHAEIALTDTGCGIPPEHLSKIFIPFFTTKSRGTGLGLSIVHGIVKNHGGSLKIQSQVGKGSTFLVSLPLRKEGSS